MKEILTNLDVRDNLLRNYEFVRMRRAHGYIPVYGPTIEDIHFGQQLLEHILKAYPGFRWVIEVRDTIITVVNETLQKNYGFRLRVSMLDNDGHVIKRWAGELLERFGIPATSIRHDILAEKPKTARGEIKVLV